MTEAEPPKNRFPRRPYMRDSVILGAIAGIITGAKVGERFGTENAQLACAVTGAVIGAASARIAETPIIEVYSKTRDRLTAGRTHPQKPLKQL